MKGGDLIFVALLGLVIVGLVYLGSEVQRTREFVEPLATSPLVTGISRIGVA